ncbi:MAG: CDP-diacylglycerol--glycerol-3-phosphate 3-phosphatidyltransferase [Amphritea sp.]|nr:CDP-diacylglycerol--glycerol-3-phosphate 3-phosphatidyltransferase [Amphritea sp.]
MKIPNILTLMRIVLIPIFVVVYYLPYAWAPMAAAGVFFLAGVTDWLDGYLARKLEQTSPFGAFLDPVADKLMVATALVLLVDTFSTFWITVPAGIIIGREIVISALREWMAELGKRANIAVSQIGKAKTALQMLAIFLMLGAIPYGTVSWVGIVSLYLASVLTLWSMYVYLKAAWPDLTHDI